MLRFKQFEALGYEFYVCLYADISNSVCFDLVAERNGRKDTLINGCSVADYATGIKELIEWRINNFLLLKMLEDFKALTYKLQLCGKIVIRKIDDCINFNGKDLDVYDFNGDYDAFKKEIINLIKNIAQNTK